LIDRDFNDGRQENIRGVPTIFVNGKMLSQQSLSGFQQAIEAELKKIVNGGDAGSKTTY
jgi:protein-disulfide isomerase